jgi:hypothetical protein
MARMLTTSLEEPVLVEGIPLQLEVSIGIALYPAHGSDSLTLLRHADIAMHTAKRNHEKSVLYDTHLDQFRTPFAHLPLSRCCCILKHAPSDSTDQAHAGQIVALLVQSWEGETL